MTRLSLTHYIDVERLVHSLKTVIACFLALIVGVVFKLHSTQWVVITILVLMCAQIYVGSVLQKSWLRFLGTCAGCLVAALTIVSFGVNDFSVAFAIGISSFIFSYLATGYENLTYAGTLGAVTTAIIMLGQVPTLIFAMERFLEISIGILIATLVSQFVLPVHARTHLRQAQVNTLEKLREYYEIILTTKRPNDPDFDYHDFEEDIVKTLMKQRQLAKESKREPLGIAFDPKHFTLVLYAEREILRAISYMHNALMQSQSTRLQKTPAYTEFNILVLNTFKELSLAMEKDNPETLRVHIPSLQPLKSVIQSNSDICADENYLYMNSFLFSAEILVKNLIDIAKLRGIKLSYQE